MTQPLLLVALAVAMAGLTLPARAVVADRETITIADPADADDPAFWIHPTDPSKSLVVTAVKDGGGRVFGLDGALQQTLDPFPTINGRNSRFNNVDVQYGFDLNGTRVDLAVATDRGQDVLRIWSIDGNNATQPLTYVGVDAPDRAFVDLPDGSANPLSRQNTAYGIALYRDVAADRLYAFATQRSQARIAQYELVATADNKVAAQYLRDYDFPSMAGGTVDLTGKQFEGMVVDQQTGILYAGQEDVGIWRVDIEAGIADSDPFVATVEYQNGSPLQADVEGLTIYYGADGSGYLLASSQGDNSFAVFDRAGGNAYLGSFQVTASGGIDAVEESDGADVTSLSLPGYGSGVFVTQDGDDDGNGTNFKYVPWENIAAPMGLRIDTTAYDPRNPLAPVPEPQTWALLAAGLGVLGGMARRRQRSRESTNV